MFTFILIGSTVSEAILPVILPPSSYQNTTNLEQTMFGGHFPLMKQSFESSFHRLDKNKDGFLSISEVNLNKNTEVHLNKTASGNSRDKNMSLEEYIDLNTRIFTTNFTIFPSICLETLERIELCDIDLDVLVTDYDLPLTNQEYVLSYKRTIVKRVLLEVIVGTFKMFEWSWKYW